jgi:hypothetical protein
MGDVIENVIQMSNLHCCQYECCFCSWLLYGVDVNCVEDVSEIRATYIFRIEICKFVSFCVYKAFCFEK